MSIDIRKDVENYIKEHGPLSVVVDSTDWDILYCGTRETTVEAYFYLVNQCRKIGFGEFGESLKVIHGIDNVVDLEMLCSSRDFVRSVIDNNQFKI